MGLDVRRIFEHFKAHPVFAGQLGGRLSLKVTPGSDNQLRTYFHREANILQLSFPREPEYVTPGMLLVLIVHALAYYKAHAMGKAVDTPAFLERRELVRRRAVREALGIDVDEAALAALVRLGTSERAHAIDEMDRRVREGLFDIAPFRAELPPLPAPPPPPTRAERAQALVAKRAAQARKMRRWQAKVRYYEGK